ncbi:MAG: DUF1232 domain-containing protein [Desulfobacterales bacterium]|nr:DUF1232 domain-containing protein [Desulfobacterales bacterium]
MKGKAPGRFNLLRLIKRFPEDISLLFAMIKDIAAGRYRKIPIWSIGVFVFAVLYIFFPFDMVPDFIPGYGQIDDAVIALLCLYLMENDLKRYNDWKNQS